MSLTNVPGWTMTLLAAWLAHRSDTSITAMVRRPAGNGERLPSWCPFPGIPQRYLDRDRCPRCLPLVPAAVTCPARVGPQRRPSAASSMDTDARCACVSSAARLVSDDDVSCDSSTDSQTPMFRPYSLMNEERIGRRIHGWISRDRTTASHKPNGMGERLAWRTCISPAPAPVPLA